MTARRLGHVSSWPISAKLLATSVVAIVAMASLALVAVWVVLGDRAAVSDLERLGRAARTLETADMQHDAVLSKVYAVLLDPGRAGQRRSELDAETRAYSHSLAQVLALPLPDRLRELVRDLDRHSAEYTREAEHLAHGPVPAAGSMAAATRPLEDQFGRLRTAHAAVNLAFADALVHRQAEADARARRGLLWLGLLCLGAAALQVVVVRHLAGAVPRDLQRVYEATLAMADGDLATRIEIRAADEVGAVAGAVNRMAERLQSTFQKLQSEQDHDAFGRQVADAIDMTDSISDLTRLVARAMGAASSGAPMEMLLADGEGSAQLQRVAQHPTCGPAGCQVGSLNGCVAAKRGQPVTFGPGHGLTSCRFIEARSPGHTLNAACVPLVFMGQMVGVLHATEAAPGAVDQALPKMVLLGRVTGNRVGALRAAERTRLQADTDALTGLLNRRSLEERVARIKPGMLYAAVLSDVDHFKRVNDSYGHAVGDRALMLYARVLRDVLRERDVAARWGGEEFLAVLEDCDALTAVELSEQVRRNLRMACEVEGLPAFTASFGIADATMGTSFAEVVGVADVALYQSKELGRDRITVGDGMRMADDLPLRDPNLIATFSLNRRVDDQRPN